MSDIYQPLSDSTVLTKGSTFGGPDDSEDNGKFAFGGESDMDGQINPEYYAAFPSELYKKGVVKPGGIYRVTNPKTGVTIPVVARDKGPSESTGRGIDLAPHALGKLGAETDEGLQVDFTPMGEAPVVGSGPGPHNIIDKAAQVFNPALSLSGVDTSALNVGGDVQPSPNGGPVPLGGARLTAINEAGSQPDIDQTTGLPITDQDSDLANLNALDEKETDTPDHPEHGSYSGQVPTISQYKGGRPVPVEDLPDGGTRFSDGAIAYPGGFVRRVTGDQVITETPDGKRYVKPVKAEKGPDKILEETAARKGVLRSDFKSDDEFKKAAKAALGYYPPNTDIGEAALSNETPSTKARIESIVSGRTPPPPLSRNNPINNHIWDLIYAKDPNYSPQSFAAYKNFTTGKDAESLTAMDAALGHLADFKDNIAKLDPSKYKSLNKLSNLIKSNTDDPTLKRIQSDAVALQAQLAGFYKGQGRAPTDPEMQAWQKIFDEASGPQQLNAAVDETLKLMSGQYNSIKNKFLRVSGQGDTSFQFLPAPTQKLLKQKFGIDDLGNYGQDTASAPSGAGIPTPQSPAEYNALKSGTVYFNIHTGKNQTKP